MYSMYSMNHSYVDLSGNPIDKNPKEYPYSYDPFVLFRDNEISLSFIQNECDAFDSDRLESWYPNEISQFRKDNNIGHGNMYWAYTEFKDKLDEMISELFKKKCKIAAIIQNCNISSGYPYWTIYYYEEVTK